MNEAIINLFIVLLLGAFVGLQFRKIAEEGHFEKHVFAGMRTCMTITLLGFVSTYLSTFNQNILILGGAFLLVLILLSYAQSAFQDKRIGGTTEIILAMLFLVGVLMGYQQMEFAISLTIILSIIASGRTQLYSFSDRFSKVEIIETVKFAIIVFLILPLLPNHAIDPWGAINPYSVWLMVILISGIGFVGYMGSKFMGKNRSILLTALVGGTVSSTAVTTTMAVEQKKNPKLINIYSIAILLSSLTMFVRVIIEVFIFNPALLTKLLIPLGAMLFTMLIFNLIYYRKREKPKKNAPTLKNEVKLETPFSLKPAIKFSLFFVFILLFIRLAEQYLGNRGVYLTAIISSLADIDAISISLSQLSATQSIEADLAIRAITYAVISNTFIKIVYIHVVGTRQLTKKVFSVFLITALVGVLASFLI